MTWIEYQLAETPELNVANYGTVWHLDHVRPCASFNLVDTHEQRRCYHWSNLQPLAGEENIRKSDSILHDHLTRQLERYDTFRELHNKDNSKYDITASYRDLLDGASPTTTAEKSANGTQDNDLGHGNNGEDWAIRSQDILLERLAQLEQLVAKQHKATLQLWDYIQQM